MIFFGWGTSSTTKRLSDTQVLALRYSYFHLFWLFRITVPRGYTVATATDAGWLQRPLEPSELAQAADDLRIAWWWRWGLLVVVALLIVLVVVSAVLR
jgi:hypothetical protein